MKTSRLLLTIALLICVLSGCGVSTKLPDEPIVFDFRTNEDKGYAYLSVDDKIYVPYCPFKRRYIGDCIGYFDAAADEYSGGSRWYVYEFNGYSSDEWIIDYLPTINEGMIYREINTTNIPEGLSSEYEWNN